MQIFEMNSLIGTDENGIEHISYNDVWIPLNEETYRIFYEEVKKDNAEKLLKLIELSGQVPISNKNLHLHFMEYDIPALVISSPDSIDNLFDKIANDTPGMHADTSQKEQRAVCHRNRLPSEQLDQVCLFPMIIMAQKPPEDLSNSPLLSHEMVHLKHTLTEKYGETQIRLSFWNADLQDYYRENFNIALKEAIISTLGEEWEACKENFDEFGRNQAFTSIHIPHVLSSCALKLDWWLNDEKRYLNIGRTATLISETVFDSLTKLGYNDSKSNHPMNPTRWKEVVNHTFRDAYKRWQKFSGPFKDRLTEAITS